MSKGLVDYSNPNSLGSRFRAKRIAPLVELIENVYQKKGNVSILDIGGRKSYWNIIDRQFLKDNNVSIILLNLPDDLDPEVDDDLFKIRAGDACNSGYEDNAFDIVHSNSVIEHVGSWNNIKKFASESIRLAPNHFIQTPYFWFPIEPHFLKPFIHWLPRPWRFYLFTKFNMGNRKKAATWDKAIESVENEPWLLDQRTFKFLFPESQLIKERYFLFVKSLVAFKKV